MSKFSVGIKELVVLPKGKPLPAKRRMPKPPAQRGHLSAITPVR